jgi:hypothetical protein
MPFKIAMTIIKLFYPNVEYRPYSQLYELHECSCFRLNPAYPYEEDLANTELTPVNYPKNTAIGQLKSEIRKTVAEFRTYAQKQIDNDGYVKFLKVTLII